MEFNTLEKLTNNSVASSFLHEHFLEFNWESKFVMPFIDFSEIHFGSS